eukprot:TRINITY_DN9866_c0_g1_i1.p1 TRINITY_DN9866_c0_g1~~TRINITY_DN9866_c0_g1_i1.p1  ORF type:complete len:139 (+),score=36.57 TRINITY_DN9866_c0_g1_i1:54-470(+)
MCDVSDPQIAEDYQEISNLRGSTNWILLGYTDDRKPTLKVVGKGSDGASGAVALLKDDQVNYGILRVNFTAEDNTERTKFVFFAWAGPSASILKKGKMSVHKASVKTIFKDFALEFQTDNRDDLAESAVVSQVKRVNY